MNRVLAGVALGFAAATALGQTTTTIPVPVPKGSSTTPAAAAGGSTGQPVELEMRFGKSTYPVRINQALTVTTPKGEKVDVLIRRRDVLQFTGAGITFSYPRQMQVTTSNAEGVTTVTAESLGSTLALVQVFSVPTSPDAVQKQLADSFRKEFKQRGASGPTYKPMQRKIGGTSRKGALLEWNLAGQRLRSEIYAYQKDSLVIAAVFQRAAEDEKQATRYFAIISDSLK